MSLFHPLIAWYYSVDKVNWDKKKPGNCLWKYCAPKKMREIENNKGFFNEDETIAYFHSKICHLVQCVCFYKYSPFNNFLFVYKRERERDTVHFQNISNRFRNMSKKKKKFDRNPKFLWMHEYWRHSNGEWKITTLYMYKCS